MQRKVVLLRDDKDMSWDGIADPKIGGIMNLAGLPTCRDVVKRAYEKYFKRGRGKSKYDYRKCGRKRWKMTLEIEKAFDSTAALNTEDRCVHEHDAPTGCGAR